MFNQSPMETLASYGIAFVAGAMSVCLVAVYGKWMQQKGASSVDARASA